MLSEGDAREKLRAILADIAATREFARAMAKGDLSGDLAVKGQMAGCLKALQSNLRHLSWQAGQIASGDLTQRIEFMGEFSDSFNAMVGHLAEDRILRAQREEELKRVNTILADEVAERRKIEESLRQANRKITMLSSITRHDIRNQLMILRGYLEISRNNISDPAVLEYISKECRAAEAISNQIEFTKFYEEIGVNAPEWQDISRLVHSVRSQLPLHDTIEVIIDLPPARVFADGLIGKVFYNLMENTLRHGEHASLIRFSFCETESGAEIMYEDNGVGISREDKPHLFQKGFGKNTGLGLFLSREILAITGLTIRETGEHGKGVRFVITIPRDAYRFSPER
jgi:signal transduction histidine kinase